MAAVGGSWSHVYTVRKLGDLNVGAQLGFSLYSVKESQLLGGANSG